MIGHLPLFMFQSLRGIYLDNFLSVSLMVLPFGWISAIAFILVGNYRDTLNLTWHLIPIMILYPLWGVIQQFLLIAMIAGNLHNMQTLQT